MPPPDNPKNNVNHNGNNDNNDNNPLAGGPHNAPQHQPPNHPNQLTQNNLHHNSPLLNNLLLSSPLHHNLPQQILQVGHNLSHINQSLRYFISRWLIGAISSLNLQVTLRKMLKHISLH